MFKHHDTSPTRTIVALVPITLVVSVAMWSMGPLAGGPALALGGPDPVFADQVTGTWLTDPKPPPPWGGPGYRIVTNFHADGTLEWSWSWENGAFGLQETSSVYGSWVQTGEFEITARELGFLYTTNGVLRYFWRFNNVYTFSPDFRTYTLELGEEFLLPEQDPTNPDEEPVGSLFEIFTAKRLEPPA